MMGRGRVTRRCCVVGLSQRADWAGWDEGRERALLTTHLIVCMAGGGVIGR